ncbi:MAG: hypothetical protein WCG03_01060 [Kiritimatiellales bacterium]
MFNWIDWSVMAFYFVGLIVLSVHFLKKASKGLDDYFLGGHSIPWWATGISGMSSQLDLTGTMLITSLIFVLGSRGMYVEIRGGLALMLGFAMVYQGKWNRRSKCMTAAEWMEFRFGQGKTGKTARLLQAFAVILSTIGAMAYFIKGAGLFLSIFFPFSPMACAIVLIIFSTIYTMISGFYGVVWTDIFQSGFILLGMLWLAVTAFMMIPDQASFEALIQTVSGNAAWSSITLPVWTEMPKAYEAFEQMALAVLYYSIFTIFFGMSSSGGKPVYLGARNDRECSKLTITWILTSSIRWPLIMGFVILGAHMISRSLPGPEALSGAAAVIQNAIPGVQPQNWGAVIAEIARFPGKCSPELINALQAYLGDGWADKIRMVTFEGTVNIEQVLPAVIYYGIPVGLRGIVFVAMLAAAMSTFSGQLNTAAGYVVKDIYQRLIRPKAGNKELVYISYIACIIIVVLSLWMSYNARSINDIWGWIACGLGGGLVLPSFLRWYWWRFNGFGYAGGMLGGMLAAVLQRILVPDWPVWYSLPVIVACSSVFALIGTIYTRPTDDAVLQNFYNITRPFGFWKPYKNTLAPAVIQRIDRENRTDISTLFLAVPWQFLIYWVSVQFMLHAWTRFWVGTGLLLICTIGLYFIWYRKLPATNSDPFSCQE